MKKLVCLCLVLMCLLSCMAQAEYTTIYDVSQFIRLIQQAERRYDTGLTVKMDASLYERYTMEQWQKYIMDATGLIYSYSISVSGFGSTRQMTIDFTQYREGAQMYRAWYEGELSSLTDEQRQALSIVMSKVMEIRQTHTTHYEQARAVHDFLCERITYDSSSGPRVRPSVGALLDGRANCQGYTDAFYLMCSMLGMEVYCQNGMADGGPHTWNLIKFNDQGWSIVDVTWDDGCRFMDGTVPNYVYFGIGSDQIRLTHQWDALCEPDDLVYFTTEDYFYYKGGQWLGSGYGRAFATAQEAAQYCLARAQSGIMDSYVLLQGAGEEGGSLISSAMENLARQMNAGCGWQVSSMARGGNTYLFVRVSHFEQ